MIENSTQLPTPWPSPSSRPRWWNQGSKPFPRDPTALASSNGSISTRDSSVVLICGARIFSFGITLRNVNADTPVNARSYRSGNIGVKWQVVEHLCTSGDGFFIFAESLKFKVRSWLCKFLRPIFVASTRTERCARLLARRNSQIISLCIVLLCFPQCSVFLGSPSRKCHSFPSNIQVFAPAIALWGEPHPAPNPPAASWTKWQHRSRWCCIWDRKWWNIPIFQHIVWRGSRSVCSAETPWLWAMDEILSSFAIFYCQMLHKYQSSLRDFMTFMFSALLARRTAFTQILPAPPLPPACSSPIGTRKFQDLHCFQYLTAMRLCAWGLLCSRLFWSHYLNAAPHSRMTSKQVTLPETAGWKY